MNQGKTQGNGGAAKKLMSLTQSSSVLIFSVTVFAPLYLTRFSYYKEQQRKPIQEAVCASGIPLLADARHCNSTILPKWLFNICAYVKTAISDPFSSFDI